MRAKAREAMATKGVVLAPEEGDEEGKEMAMKVMKAMKSMKATKSMKASAKVAAPAKKAMKGSAKDMKAMEAMQAMKAMPAMKAALAASPAPAMKSILKRPASAHGKWQKITCRRLTGKSEGDIYYRYKAPWGQMLRSKLQASAVGCKGH